MKPPKPEDLMYTAQEIGRAVIDWANFNGFSGESCGSCKATANVLALGPGWYCPCGHYNNQSWYHSQIPHMRPQYGPPQQTILDGIKSVRYAFYSAMADAFSGHCIYKVKGKECMVTIVCERKDQGRGWPDSVYLGQITIGDLVKGNTHYDSIIQSRLLQRTKNFDLGRLYHEWIDKGYIKQQVKQSPPQPIRITTVGDHQIPSVGFILPDNRLVATSAWTNADGIDFVRVKTSAEFRRLYGDDAVPVYDEPGVVARYTAPAAPKGRYRWVGDKYRFENN